MYWKVFAYLLAIASISAYDNTDITVPVPDGILEKFSVALGNEKLKEVMPNKYWTNRPSANTEKGIDPTENVVKVTGVSGGDSGFANMSPAFENEELKEEMQNDTSTNYTFIKNEKEMVATENVFRIDKIIGGNAKDEMEIAFVTDKANIPDDYLESAELGFEYIVFEKTIPNCTSMIENDPNCNIFGRKKRQIVLDRNVDDSEETYIKDTDDFDINDVHNAENNEQNGIEDTKAELKVYQDDPNLERDRHGNGFGRNNLQPKILKHPPSQPIEKTFLDTYNGSREIGFLVEDEEDTRNEALQFIITLFRLRPDGNYLNFYLALINRNGSTDFVESTKHMKNFKIQLKPSVGNVTRSALGMEHRFKSAASFAIMKSTHFLTHDSGIILFLGRGPIDEDLMGHVRTNLLLKRIKLYVVWSGPYPTKTKEETLLMEMCKVSGGVFLVSDKKNDLSEQRFKYYLHEEVDDLALMAEKKNLTGDNTISFPIDSEVTAIHIVMKPYDNDTVGLLTTSRGKRIIITDKSKVEEYNSLSFVNKEDDLYEVHLAVNLRAGYDVGIWNLKTLSTAPTNVNVYVYTKLTANVYYVTGNATKTAADRHLQFEFLGDLLTVNKIAIVNKNGKPIMNNLLKNKEYLKVSEKYENTNETNLTTNTGKTQDVQFKIALDKRLPDDKLYAMISGKDHKGYDFNRMALIRRSYSGSDDVFPQPPLTVNLGLSSSLIVQPNKYSDIYFEVTNRGNKAAQVYFSIRGEKHILYSMSPFRKILSPDETTTVKVTIAPGPGTYQDHLVFQAGGGSVSVQKTVIVDVGSDVVDNESPDISHKFLSDCTSNWGPCQDATWTIEVYAKDTESGLLQVTSNPKGLYFRNEFTAGTKEEVSGYYSGTCCYPDIIITAVDRKQNAYTKKYNAFHAIWGAAAIAGLVFGILLIILAIGAIIYFVHKWQKKRTVSFDLPVYRSKLRDRY